MDSLPIPQPDDHCRITVIVKQIGTRSTVSFNRLLERLQRVCTLQVGDSPRRVVIANVVPSVNTHVIGFSDLQAHRRVIGFIGVIQAVACDDQPTASEQIFYDKTLAAVNESSCFLQPSTSKLPVSVSATLPLLREQYDAAKVCFYCASIQPLWSTVGVLRSDFKMFVLADILFLYTKSGKHEFDDTWTACELLKYKSLEESDKLESAIRDFFRSIFFVLESKRLDLSFEKLDPAPCPYLPDEKKNNMGVESKGTKVYRKKCLGRLRKQVADYALLTGLPLSALDIYQSSIDSLKQANDYLWLAAAYEGWACAAMALKYDFSEENLPSFAMQRVSTMTPEQMRIAQLKQQRTLGVAIGHQKYRSEVDKITIAPTQAEHILSVDQQKRSFKLPWSFEKSRNGSSLDASEIFERFKLALENYERFSFVAYIEYECVMKAISLLCLQRRYIQMETFLREHTAKYLDDNFTFFDRHVKSMICLHAAVVFRSVGFTRKDAFFSRLAGLFRLHVEGTNRTFTDYRVVYPLFLRTLLAYGICDTTKNALCNLTNSGPVQLQKKVLYEVFMSALRAEYHDAAIRHLCYLLQVYFDYMDNDYVMRLFEELSRLVLSKTSVHQLNQHLTIPHCDVIVPPLQMTRFPRFEGFAICKLPTHLAPVVVRPEPKNAIFIYSPFQRNDSSHKVTYWVVECVCEVSVSVSNCLPFELSVHNLTLLAEGCTFEAVPVELMLVPSENHDAVDIKLLGVPKTPGTLTITGYSCEVFGVRNVCRLKDLPYALKVGDNSSSMFSVEVLPALPILELHSSLPRAPITDQNLEPAAEIAVYSGQTFEHAIELFNSSEAIAIHDVCLEILQPKVSGGPSLIQIVEADVILQQKQDTEIISRNIVVCDCLKPRERKVLKFRIFGIDPAAAAEDTSMRRSLDVDSKRELLEEAVDGGQDRIPFIGRLLMSAFVFRYKADVVRPTEEEYERCCRLPLAVTIMPAVTVAAWHVLPGEGPSSRYVVIDVTNSTDWDAELNYGDGKMIGVQPKELCRVPLLCECCSEVSPNAFRLAASKASSMMQMQEMERLRLILERHVSSLLDIRWTISAVSLEGSVPVGPILSSISLLKQLVVPSLSIEMVVNGCPALNEEDIAVGIGEIIELEVKLVSPVNEERFFKGVLRLDCYRDVLNGTHAIDSNGSMQVLNTDALPFILHNGTKVELGRPGTSFPASDESFASNSPAELGRHSGSVFRADFSVFFLHEGIYKVKPVLQLDIQTGDFTDDELFFSAVTFSVITKV